jgi:HEAT repeat protein
MIRRSLLYLISRSVLYLVCAIMPGSLVLAYGCVFMGKRSLPAGALHDPDPVIRAAAIRRLPRGSSNGPLIEALKDENPDVRELAAQRVEISGAKGDEGARALVQLFKDDNPSVRKQAIRQLGMGGPNGWPALKDALHDPDPRLRSGAVLAIRDAYHHKDTRAWPDAFRGEINPILNGLADDPDPEVRAALKPMRK